MSTISAARIAANKANAQRSTGPRTPEGKARVSEIALKHGLRSERNPLDLATDTTLPFERQEFLATLTAFMDDLAPHGPLETRLVERLAQIDLRRNRAVRMETTHLDLCARRVHIASTNALPDEQPDRNNWLTTLAFVHDPAALKLISQYESRLSRDFASTLTQLRQAQAVRAKGEVVQKLRAQSKATDSRNQTQSEASLEHTSADPITMPTQHPVREGRVAKSAPRNIANQTQPAPQTPESEHNLSRQSHAKAA